jgi:uncharacterized phage-associated protein
LRAESHDILTGHARSIPQPNDPDAISAIRQVLLSFGRLSPGRLVDITHAKNSPWHSVVNKYRTSALAFGWRIPDKLIAEQFKFHKVPVGEAPTIGEPSEDTPPA